MKKKFLTNTYLRGVDSYALMQFEDSDLNCYTVMKKINSIDKPYICTHLGKDICLSKEGFYTIEYLPKDKNYEVRVFLDDNMETISYYIDIINDIGIDYEKGLYYDDLYLDVTVDKVNNDKVIVWDEDELKKALDDEDISKEQYDLAYKTLRELLDEISKEDNIYINNDHKKYIQEHFKI